MIRSLLLLLLILSTTPDLNAGQWSQMSDFGSFGRHRGVAVGIGNKVYAGTGHLNGTGFDTWYSDWWEYDPANNAWTQKADYIGNNGNGDQDLTAIEIDGVGYISEGWYGGSGHYRYDPSVNSWTTLSIPPIDVANTDPFVIDGKGYYTEWGGTNVLYMYDPTFDSWTVVANMPAIITQRCATFVINGKGYFKRDYSFFEFDPNTNTWVQKTDFPGTAPNNNIGLSQGGYGFYVGGYLGWGDMYQEVWRYDPTTDVWTQMEDYPFSARRWAVKAQVGENCYVGLGTNGTNFQDWWQFDMLAGTNDLKFLNIKCFPNPTSEEIHLSWEDHGLVEIKIVAMTGELMVTERVQNGNFKINCSMWPKGNYIATLSAENGQKASETIAVQ